jgi:hypothetical protein
VLRSKYGDVGYLVGGITALLLFGPLCYFPCFFSALVVGLLLWTVSGFFFSLLLIGHLYSLYYFLNFFLIAY